MPTPLTGGRWVTIEHEHVYVRGSAIVAGHVPSDTSKSTKKEGSTTSSKPMSLLAQYKAKHGGESLKEKSKTDEVLPKTKKDVDKLVEEGQAERIFKPDNETRSTEFSPGKDASIARRKYADRYKEFAANEAASNTYRSALDDYAESSYARINTSLRRKGAQYSPTLSEQDRSLLDSAKIRQAIKAAPETTENQVLYRHFSHDPKHEVGETIKHAGFLSTSSISQPEFMDDGGKFGYEIAVPKGSKGILSGFNTGELESLIDHGAQFKVLSKKSLKFNLGTQTQTRTMYQLGYVGPGPK